MQKETYPDAGKIALLGGLTALTAVSIDIVLPAVGLIARHYGEPDHLGVLIVGVYFVAYGLGQIFWGLFSDAFGRRFALIISLSGFVAASIACTFAPTFEFLVVARVAQGLMGGAPVIARAMVRDMASGERSARIMTMLGAILTVASLMAPVIGSGFLTLFDWRAVFAVLAFVGIVFLAFSALSLEDDPARRRPERFSLTFLLSAAPKLFSNLRFLTPALVTSLTFGGYASVGATGAVIAERVYGVKPEAFGALFAMVAVANTAGALIAGQLLTVITLRRLGPIAVSILAVAVVVNLLVSGSASSLPAFWGAVCFYVFALGLIFPTGLAAAMEPAGEMPGFAASIVGALQMMFAALGSATASLFLDETQRAINWTMALFGSAAVLAMIVGRWLQRRNPSNLGNGSNEAEEHSGKGQTKGRK